MKSSTLNGNNFNITVIEAIRALGVNVNFITPSEYDK